MSAQIIQFPRREKSEAEVISEIVDEYAHRQALKAKIDRLGNWSLKHGELAAHVSNHLRVRYSVADVKEIPRDKISEAIDIVAAMSEACTEFMRFTIGVREEFMDQCIAAGEPWTPAIKAKLTRRYRERLPDRPDWLALSKRLPVESRRKRRIDD